MSASIAEIREILKDLAVSQKETNEQIKKTQASLKKLSKLFGSSRKNQGPIVEEFFYNSLKADLVVGGVKYYHINLNVKPPDNPDDEEYDIVMVNSEQVLLIEVKLKAHPSDIKQLKKKMISYKKYFPQHQDFKLIGALATFSAKAILKSSKLFPGMMILQRSGKVIKTVVS